MWQVLANVRNADCFVYEMCIFIGKLAGSHDVMTAKQFKCMIGYGSIDCLGHSIVDQTARPQEDKI